MTGLPFTREGLAQAIEVIGAAADAMKDGRFIDAAVDHFTAELVASMCKALSVAHEPDVDAMMRDRARAQADTIDRPAYSTNDLAAARADRRAVVDPLGVDDDDDWQPEPDWQYIEPVRVMRVPYSSTRWAADALDVRIVHDSAMTGRNHIVMSIEWDDTPLLPAKIVSTTIVDRAEFSRRVHVIFGVTPEDTGL